MINLDNFEKMNEYRLVFLPMTLARTISHYCNDKTNAIRRLINRGEISDNRELSCLRHDGFNKSREFWADTEFENFPESRYAAIDTNFTDDALKSLIPLFFGNSVDADVTREAATEVSTALVCSSNDNDKNFVILQNIDGNKFKAVGDYDKMVKLNKLIEVRGLTSDDIKLVLDTLKAAG